MKSWENTGNNSAIFIGHRHGKGNIQTGVNWLTCYVKTVSIDPSHESHSALENYPTTPHFVTEISTFAIQIGMLRDMELVYCGICATGLLNADSYRYTMLAFPPECPVSSEWPTKKIGLCQLTVISGFFFNHWGCCKKLSQNYRMLYHNENNYNIHGSGSALIPLRSAFSVAYGANPVW